jgi:signal transduction histidine kinase
MGSEQQAFPDRYLSRSVRLILSLAFVVLLVFLITAGWSAMLTLRQLHEREQAVRLDYLARTEPIIQARSRLTLYGDLVQDSGASEDRSSAYAHQLISQIAADLDRYPHSRTAEEQSLLNHLQAALDDQEHLRTAMFALHDPERKEIALGTQVLPSHLRAIAATEQIDFWNTTQLRASNSDLLASFNRIHDRLRLLLLILFASALAIALGSLFVVSSQEKEIRSRYAELNRNHEVQTQLAARLLNAQEQERLSISRELHDEVGQSLGALLVDMGRLSAILPPNDAPAQEALRRIRASAEESVSAVRNIALLLRPSMLDDLGLVAAIEWQAREISRRSNVEVEVEAGEISPGIQEDIKVCIYRLSQEALNNVARHSGARHAWVSLQSDERRIDLRIRDDGKGFDPERSRGLGLLGMKERLRLLHGLLVIRSAPGEGTEITAELPLA